MTPLAVVAPPRVHALIRAAPDGPARVLHAGESAIYVEIEGRCIGVLAAGAARVPCGLRTPLKHLQSLFSTNGGLTAYRVGGTLHVGSRSLTVGRIAGAYVPRISRGDVCSTETSPVTVEATPPATVTGFVAAVLPRGRVGVEDVTRLIGRGEGLTPLGDDLLCGWLALHRAAGVATPAVDAVVRAHLDRTTLLSATLLDCALHGEVLPEFAAWVTAIGTPEAADRAHALDSVGATSGAGLRHGARIAIDQLKEAA